MAASQVTEQCRDHSSGQEAAGIDDKSLKSSLGDFSKKGGAVHNKLAIVATHPIQYFSPWYRYLAARCDISIRVFYLWDFGVNCRLDPGFQQSIKWDIPLLSGYDYMFVPNRSRAPGTHRFFGLWNPSSVRQVKACQPSAILMLGYNFATFMYLILRVRHTALIFRGDSHRLVRRAGLRESIRRKLISLIFRRFSAFLYVGSANYEYFRYHGVRENKLFKSPHAVDNERFFASADSARVEAATWRAQLGIPHADLVILFAGKLESKKRPLDLLSAYLEARLDDVSLLFVGSGPLEDEIKGAAKGHPKVYFARFQNQTLMPRTYCAGDVFVLPSYGGGETWGLAINEAMCMGRAVIVSDHVGCARDLVVPYQNGLIFPAGDVSALAACLREAVSDKARLERWGERSRLLIQSYSYRQATDGLIKAMTSLGVLGSRN